MKQRLIRLFVALGLLTPLLAAAPVRAATTTQVVAPVNLALPASPTTITNSWYFYDDTGNSASATQVPGNHWFTNGPGTPNLGAGSVSFDLSAANERWNVATNQFAGQNLSSWDELSFDMYTPSTSSAGTTYTLFLNFDVDFDTTKPGFGDTNTANVSVPYLPYQHRLVYVPQQNGSPLLNTWQTWNAGAESANWTWSRFAQAGNKWPDGNMNEYRTWSDLKTAFPNIGVFNEGAAGQFLVRAGHPGPVGLQGSVDNVVVGDTAFNFEAVYPATATITNPLDGNEVRGLVSLSAVYDDGESPNTDGVQWAMRTGSTCAAGAGTVFGNVDGKNTSYNWDGKNFSSTVDTATLEDGQYCFVFNPVDDPGQNVRVVSAFTVDNRPDNKEECKNGGWKLGLSLTEQNVFKNQGDCVSYFATKMKNGPAMANSASLRF